MSKGHDASWHVLVPVSFAEERPPWLAGLVGTSMGGTIGPKETSWENENERARMGFS